MSILKTHPHVVLTQRASGRRVSVYHSVTKQTLQELQSAYLRTSYIRRKISANPDDVATQETADFGILVLLGRQASADSILRAAHKKLREQRNSWLRALNKRKLT